jgi:enoyl-CoA hydratase/carnithine racemase
VQAEEAGALGIVLEIVDVSMLLERAMEIARGFAAKPPQALRIAKRLMKSAQRMQLGDFLDHCAVFQGICHNTADHVEAVASMLEKRQPRFNGR